MSNAAADLLSLLRQSGSETTSDIFTHELLYSRDGNGKAILNGRRYQVSPQNLGQLWETYCELRDLPGDHDLSLAEKPKDVMHFMVKLKLEFEPRGFDEPFDDIFVYTFIYRLQQIMIKYLNLQEMDMRLLCVAMESQPYDVIAADNELRKRIDVRFQFPLCRCSVETQKEILSRHFLRLIRSSNWLGDTFSQPPIGDWKDIIDTDFYYRSIPVLGSKGSPDAQALAVTKIVGPLTEEQLDSLDIIPDLSPEEFFHFQDHQCVNSGTVPASIFRNSGGHEHWMPFFLSVDYGYRVVLSRQRTSRSPGEPRQLEPVEKKIDLKNFGGFGRPAYLSKMEMARTFLGMLSAKFFLKKDIWYAAGEALYDSCDGSDEGLQIWIDYTNQAIKERGGRYPVYIKEDVETYCGTKYFNFTYDRITTRSLAVFARECDRKAYTAWHEEWCRPAYEKAAMSNLDADVALAFYRTYWLEAMCTGSGRKATWYLFKNNHLKESPGGVDISKMLTGVFQNRFYDLSSQINEELKGTADKEEQKQGRAIQVGILNVIKMLSKAGSKRSIMSELSELFMRPGLESHLDNNPNLMGLQNGILSADEFGITIRHGRLEDYVTRTATVSYPKSYTWDHPQVKAILKWLRQTWNDPALERQVRKVFASILRGGNNDKRFYVFSGENGDNSKSMWIKALVGVLGPYAVKFPVALVTGGRGDANGPAPALARSKGTRLTVLEEPDEGVPIKGAMIKYLTGNDSFYARMLKKNGGDITPLFKLFLVCNTIPAMPTGGEALVKRMTVLPCLSTWIDQAPEDEEEQFRTGFFQMDKDFDQKISDMRAALLWVMVQDYQMYLEEGVREAPKIVQEYTAKYWDDNDIYNRFVCDNISAVVDADRKADASVKMDVNAVWTVFKFWFKDGFPGARPVQRPLWRKEMIRLLGIPVDGQWSAFRLNSDAVSAAEQGGAHGGAGGAAASGGPGRPGST